MFKVTNLETNKYEYAENTHYAYNYICRYALDNDMYITYNGSVHGVDSYSLESWHGEKSTTFTIEKC